MLRKFRVTKKSWITLLLIGGTIEEMTPLQVKVTNSIFTALLLALFPVLFGVTAARGLVAPHWLEWIALTIGMEIVCGVAIVLMWHFNNPRKAGVIGAHQGKV